MKSRSLLVVFVSVAVLLAPAQETTLTARSNVVIVPALVLDPRGEPIYGLSEKDFVIEDDGVAQVVHLDDAAESEPLSLMMVLQVGRKAKSEFPRMKGVSAMLEPVLSQPETETALLLFDGQLALTQDFTTDGKAIQRDLTQLQPGDDSAAILDAVAYGVKLLDKRPTGRQKVLLLISETRDHGSHFSRMEDLVSLIGDSNDSVYALSFSPALSNVLDTERGSNKDDMRKDPDLLAPLVLAVQAMRKNTPKQIAAQTGGEYQLFDTRKVFESRFTDFTNHLHSRYVLSFEPKDPQPGLHHIQVRLREPNGKTVAARNSYWAEH